MSLETGNGNDTMGSQNDPLVYLAQNKNPQEIVDAWIHLARTAPENLTPHYSISIELNFCRDCTKEQYEAITQSLAQILGVLPGINQGTVSRPADNVIALDTKLYRGYEAAIVGYLRKFTMKWLNSPENTFLLSIRVHHDGENPMDLLAAGKSFPDIDEIPGYFENFSLHLQK